MYTYIVKIVLMNIIIFIDQDYVSKMILHVLLIWRLFLGKNFFSEIM